MMKVKFILIFAFMICCRFISAQNTEALHELTSPAIRIGEQDTLVLKLHYREGSKKADVMWPEIKDTLNGHLEIVKMDSIKTSLVDRASVLYEQSRRIVFTGFDSGYYSVAPFRFLVNGDTFFTDSLHVFVNTVPVDTTKDIKDIKKIYDVPPPPPVPSDYTWLWYMLGALVLAAAIVVTIVLLTRRKTEPLPTLPPRIIPPHEKYLEMLAKLGMEKPWLKNELKPYYISLTEIIRSWIVDRYRISAREMTSREIITALRALRADETSVRMLENLLTKGDMVKFAKAIPDADDCEKDLQQAINYVNMTIPVQQMNYTQMFN